MKTTKDIILTALSKGKPVTLSRLTEMTGSTKVSTRISDLRKDGYNIKNALTYGKGRVFQKSTYTLLP